MLAHFADASLSLDVGTLFVIATCVATLLGMFLLFAWMQDRVAALAWWGGAYLLGGVSGVIWHLGDAISPFVPPGIANVLLFIAVGMIWSAARLFHGRPVLWGGMCLGAAVWLSASMWPGFKDSAAAHVAVSCLVVATYTFLIAAELWRERRKSLLRRWPAIFVPILHGTIFLFPLGVASLSNAGGDLQHLGSGWIAVFTIEIVLYVVGAAFIVLVLAKDSTVRQYKRAAQTDPLTDLLNRRGFYEAAAEMMGQQQRVKGPVSVLAFDLDHFKSINDRFGHHTGDATLHLFAKVVKKTMRANDIIGRLGGEEFVAIVAGTLSEAGVAAERVRRAFEWASGEPGTKHVPATVSVGIACGSPHAAIDTLITRADTALYQAKSNGRNRVEAAEEAVGAAQDEPELALLPKQSGDRSLALAGCSRRGRQSEAFGV
jgi:diguanylate cyclase (GGDEF)-like protein